MKNCKSSKSKLLAAALSVVAFFAFCVLAGEPAGDMPVTRFALIKAGAFGVFVAVVTIARRAFPEIWENDNV